MKSAHHSGLTEDRNYSHLSCDNERVRAPHRRPMVGRNHTDTSAVTMRVRAPRSHLSCDRERERAAHSRSGKGENHRGASTLVMKTERTPHSHLTKGKSHTDALIMMKGKVKLHTSAWLKGKTTGASTFFFLLYMFLQNLSFSFLPSYSVF